MSRHRAVRNLNLDEELADDDDEYDDNPYNDISEEDHLQLEDALAQLVNHIGAPGAGSGFTEREMKDALWDAYFDVDQALNALVEERSKRESREKKKADDVDEDDPTLSALQRLSLKRRAQSDRRPDGNPNVAKGIRGLHFGGRAGLAKKNLASMAPDGLPGTSEREDGWNGFNGDVDLKQAAAPAKGNKRRADVQIAGNVDAAAAGAPSEGLSARPSKLAALAASRSARSSGPNSAPSPSPSISAPSDGKPLSKLQLKVQANLAARQQKKHSTVSKEEETAKAFQVEAEERARALLLPTGKSVASLFPVQSQAQDDSAVNASKRSAMGGILHPVWKEDLNLPGGSPLLNTGPRDVFATSSPDDVVLRAREGTRLTKT